MKRYCLTGPFLSTLWLLLLSAPLAQALPIVDLRDSNTESNLAMEMLGMDADKYPVRNLHQALESKHWVPTQESSELLSQPREHSTLWLQALLINSGEKPVERWLTLSPWRLGEIDAWLLDADTGELHRHINTGLDTPVIEREVNSTRPLIPIVLESGGSIQLVLRLRTENLPYLKITSWKPTDFTLQESERFHFHSILLTVIITLFIVLVLQFDRRYILLGLWVIALFILQAEKEGYISHILFQGLSNHSANLRFSSSLAEKSLFLTASVYLLGLQHHRYARILALMSLSITAIAAGIGFLLEDNQLRYLGITIHFIFLAMWVSLVPPSLKKSHKWQKPILYLLLICYFTTAFFVVSYAANIHHPVGLTAFRVIILSLATLCLIFIYTLQKNDYKKFLENKLATKEKDEKEKLQQAIIERTKALNEALDSARRANAAKTDFLSRVTHDLKSPLTSILGYSQILRLEKGAVGRMSHTIHNSSQHMLNMVNRLIDYARDVTTTPVNNVDIYFHSFLDNIKKEAEVLSSKNNNSFNLMLSPSLPAVIYSDETFLREILLNLIDNACKHTHHGNVSLKVGYKSEPINTTMQLNFLVEDTGCGIPFDKQKNLFAPFYQASNKAEGVGLGLSIVDELVKRLEGEIQLTSTPGTGTRVLLTLPVWPGEEGADTALLRMPGHMLPSVDACGLSAWVVEDAPAISELLTLELQYLGFAVQTFDTAEIAVQTLKETRSLPDLIMTDYRLPGASGDTVLQAARELRPDLPVILLSATWSLRPAEETLVGGGYSDCLGKPVDLVRLRRAIARACKLDILAPPGVVPPTNHLPETEQFEMSQDMMAKFRQWIELGAVTDFIEWCDEVQQRFPELESLANDIRQLAERGDFTTLEHRIEQLHQSFSKVE